MRKIIIVILAVSCVVAAAHDPDSSELVDMPLSKAFIPAGFDSNDLSQLVVAGTLPNTCYRIGPNRFDIDPELQRIEIRQQAYLSSGVCMPVTTPFFREIDFGVLGVGGYAIVDATSGTELGVLEIVKAPGTWVDDFAFAELSDAYVVRDESAQKTTLVLQGNFTSRCMRVKEITVAYYPDVIVVYPITELIEGMRECTEEHVRFHEEVPLKELESQVYLVHVRAAKGKSINRIYDGTDH